jgi:capsular exopolysaccharide synthesis family protein
LVMGGMIAAGAVYLFELYKDQFRSADEVRHYLATPILGSIRRVNKIPNYNREALVAINDPNSADVESFRRLRTNLRFADVDRELHTVAVTSANPNEGKSLIAANLAIVLAQAELSVILIDADLRRPRQHQFFEVARAPGVSDALYNDTFEGLDLLLQATSEPNLRLLTVGRKAPNPAELLGSQRMRELLAALRQRADFIVIDTPPILAVADSQIIGTQVDGTLLVIDTKRTTRKMARLAVEALDQVQARLIGVTLNRIEGGAQGYGYYYDHYSYYGDDEGDSGTGDGGKKAKSKNSWLRRSQPTPQPAAQEQQVYAARTGTERSVAK